MGEQPSESDGCSLWALVTWDRDSKTCSFKSTLLYWKWSENQVKSEIETRHETHPDTHCRRCRLIWKTLKYWQAETHFCRSQTISVDGETWRSPPAPCTLVRLMREATRDQRVKMWMLWSHWGVRPAPLDAWVPAQHQYGQTRTGKWSIDMKKEKGGRY